LNTDNNYDKSVNHNMPQFTKMYVCMHECQTISSHIIISHDTLTVNACERLLTFHLNSTATSYK